MTEKRGEKIEPILYLKAEITFAMSANFKLIHFLHQLEFIFHVYQGQTFTFFIDRNV